MRYFIITGTGSGLGEALAASAMRSNHKVFCISRTLNPKLRDIATEMKTGFWYFEQDLTETAKIPSLLNEVFSFIDPSVVTEITLINNAGVLEPVGPLGTFREQDIVNHISINFTAPFVLSNQFIIESGKLNCKKYIINISSGAASNPYYGWSLYCSTKAGLDMLTRSVGTEQAEVSSPVKIMSIAPGVVDTGMQEKIRNIDPALFPMKEKFVKLYEEQKLVSPEDAAKALYQFLESDYSVNGQITDLRKI